MEKFKVNFIVTEQEKLQEIYKECSEMDMDVEMIHKLVLETTFFVNCLKEINEYLKRLTY